MDVPSSSCAYVLVKMSADEIGGKVYGRCANLYWWHQTTSKEKKSRFCRYCVELIQINISQVGFLF